jgi:nucleotide-binding universal stress UspA family protein
VEDVLELFEKILVPIDGSEHSLRALDVAIQIAKEFHGKLSLIHVYYVSVTPVIVPEPSAMTLPSAPLMTSVEISKVAEAARDVGNRILLDGASRAKAAKVEVETLLKEGHTVQEIIKTAKEGDFGLIAIGARGLSHIRVLLLGSTTDGVIHHASCPVLVVK